MDKKALYKFTYGLYVVSSEYDGKKGGCVVNTLQQVTSEPPKISVAVNKSNFTNRLIADSGKFAAVALANGIRPEVIGKFGFMSGKDMDKFSEVENAVDLNGVPYLNEGICARFSCIVTAELDVGTHTIFIGKLEDAEVLEGGEPLTYKYYREVIKGTTPANAPSYQAPSI